MKLGKSNKSFVVSMSYCASVFAIKKDKKVADVKHVDDGVYFKLVTAEERAKYRCEAYSYIL